MDGWIRLCAAVLCSCASVPLFSVLSSIPGGSVAFRPSEEGLIACSGRLLCSGNEAVTDTHRKEQGTRAMLMAMTRNSVGAGWMDGWISPLTAVCVE